MNKVYDNEMYNKDIKERFLSNYTSKTQDTYRRILKKTAGDEFVLEMDLYDFDLTQLDNALRGLNPGSPASSRTNGTIVNTYIDWAIKERLRANYNPLRKIGTEFFDAMVEDESKTFFTEHEILQCLQNCRNAQDAVIIALIFNGLNGEGCSELINLKGEDVNFETNEITLHRGTVKITEACKAIVKEAIDQEVYYKKNGNMSDDTHMNVFSKLVQNNFVIRSSIGRTDAYEEIDRHTILRRLKMISRDLGIDYLTPKHISRSGMLRMAKNFYVENGEITSEDYEAIQKQFGFKNIYQMKEFINVDMIKKVYGLK